MATMGVGAQDSEPSLRYVDKRVDVGEGASYLRERRTYNAVSPDSQDRAHDWHGVAHVATGLHPGITKRAWALHSELDRNGRGSRYLCRRQVSPALHQDRQTDHGT